MSYKMSPAYVWYLNEAGGKTRCNRLPGYETDEVGRLIVAVGEVYCRAEVENGLLCHHDKAFSSTSSLNKHLDRGHGFSVASLKGGPVSAADSQKAAASMDVFKPWPMATQ
ncbi:hypothetical protein PG989_004371 [Apiospora arundinis]